MVERQAKKIIINLEKFDIDLNFPEKNIDLRLDFSKTPRPFHLAVIALAVNKSKKNKFPIWVPLKENYKTLQLLDKKLSIDQRFISKTENLLYQKISKAWNKRLCSLSDQGLFDVLKRGRLLDPIKGKYSYECESDEEEFWEKLIKIFGSNEAASLKFAVDEVNLTLDDVKIKFKDNEENAWERFVDSLKDQKSKKMKEERNRVDSKFRQKKEVIRFLRNFEERFMYLKLLHSPQRILMRDQFIPMRVTQDRIDWKDQESLWDYTDSEKELDRAYAFKYGGGDSLPQISWNEAKERSERIMVLADPGMGKTTLLRMEAATIARLEKKKLENNEITVNEAIFPIFLRLPDISECEEAIIDEIPKLVKRKFKKLTRQIIDLLIKKLQSKKCILFLDALDEVPIARRKKLSDKLDDFIENYPCQIICTSRIVGYPGFFLQNAKEVEIVPFNQEQIRNYIKSWFERTADIIENESISAKSLLLELEKKPQIKGLAQNPLLLSVICSLYQERDIELPTRRCIVFQKSLDYMLSKWGRKRTQQSEARIEAKLNLLENLAYNFLSCDKEILPLGELLKYTKDFLDQGQALIDFNNAASIITELSEDDGIFVKLEREGNRYIFFHRSFQEYLAASYLDQIFKDSVQKGIESVRKFYWDFGWHETIALLAGMLRNPIPLIKDIASQKDDIFGSLLLLAGKCVADSAKISNKTIDKILIKLFVLCFLFPEERYIAALLATLGKSYMKITNMFINILNEEDDNSLFKEKLNAVFVLKNIGNPESIKALLKAVKGESEINVNALMALESVRSFEGVEVLIQALKDDDSRVKKAAINALKRISSPESVKALTETLKYADREIQEAAADALGRIGTPESLTALIKVLRESDSIIKRYATWALGNTDISVSERNGRFGYVKIVNALKHALKDDDTEVQKAAVYSLGQIGTLESYNILIQALKDDNSIVRRCAATALGRRTILISEENRKFVLKEIVNGLKQTLEDDDSEVQKAAVYALGDIGTPETVKILIRALSDGESAIRRYAVIALGRATAITRQRIDRFGYIEIVNSVRQALKDNEREVGKYAESTLRNIRWYERRKASMRTHKVDYMSKIAKPLAELESFIKQDRETLPSKKFKSDRLGNKKINEESIEKIGDTESVEILFKALKYRNGTVDQIADTALKKIGRHRSVKALVKILNGDDPEVKLFAAATLKLICISEDEDTLCQALIGKDLIVVDILSDALKRIGTLASLKRLIVSSEIDIHYPAIFSLARYLAIRYSKENVDFIPVYPKKLKWSKRLKHFGRNVFYPLVIKKMLANI